MIKQAMILAAGKGTRMRPLTLTTPKPLVPVANKPLILWHIQRLAAAGIRHIVLNAGYLSDVLVAGLDKLDLENKLNIRLKISIETGEPLETAGGIKYALDQGLLHDEPFILVNGDVWSEYDFCPLVEHDLADNLAHLLLVDNPEHNPAGDFVLNHGKVSTKTTDQTANDTALTFAGISVMSPRLLADVGVGEIAPLAPCLRAAMADGQITGEHIADKWVDVGTLERLAGLEQYLAKSGK
ncbi:NDP-sugar synthase [Moraxella sp. ZJ142]|uniref:nucleotidyltransferase family protein n=1 Tax=Moraxella marmotae TaxID=3344520 RepID=UPI0035D4C21B